MHQESKPVVKAVSSSAKTTRAIFDRYSRAEVSISASTQGIPDKARSSLHCWNIRPAKNLLPTIKQRPCDLPGDEVQLILCTSLRFQCLHIPTAFSTTLQHTAYQLLASFEHGNVFLAPKTKRSHCCGLKAKLTAPMEMILK